MPVPVKTHNKIETGRWFTFIITTVADIAVVYDEEARKVDIVTNAGAVGTKEAINPFPIFVGVTLLLMMAFNLSAGRGRKGAALAFAFTAFVITLEFTFAIATFPVAVAVVAFVNNTADRMVYQIASIASYACIAISVAAMYE